MRSMDVEPPEINAGWRTLLRLSFFYRIVQFVFSEKRSKQLILDKYVLPAGRKCHVLDMGCGPGNLLRFLPPTVSYTGFDVSQEYIESAKKAHSGRKGAQFICATSNDSQLRQSIPDKSVDVVIVHGVFHHVEDAQAKDMFKLARLKLRRGGQMVILEPVYFPSQSRFRRWVMSKDRGKNIKYLEDWRVFFESCAHGWAGFRVEVYPNLIRFYDLVVCTVTAK